MRVFVVEPDGMGGMIHYAYQLCAALAGEGVDVTLVTSTHYELDAYPHRFTLEKRMRLWPAIDPRVEGRRATGLLTRAGHQLRWTLRRGARAMRLMREWHRLTRYLIRERPDVVQFSVIRFPFQALFLNRLRRHDLTLTQICHEFELRESRGGHTSPAAHRLFRRVYPYFSMIFFHGEANRRRFLSLFDLAPHRTRVIPHGNEAMFMSQSGQDTDLRQHYGLGPDEPVVLFFGGWRPSKGLPDLLEAFREVRRRSDARLIVAGYPGNKVNPDRLEALAHRLGIGDAVIFDPRYLPILQVGPLMRTADVVAFPYRSGTASGSLQVAYTFGRPVVATKVGGIPEAVEDGSTGLLVPPRSPEQLARAILRVLHDDNLAREMGRNAGRLSERYSWSPIAARILVGYRDVLDLAGDREGAA
ncbi:MAG: glycosyltransferase family 4 protein [Acidimicrobiia bacterium]